MTKKAAHTNFANLSCYNPKQRLMIRSWRVLFFCCLAAAFFACNDKKADDIPASDFFTSSEKTNFKISPNGKYVSYLKLHNGKRNVFIKKLDDGSEVRATSFTDFDVNDYFWTFDNQVLFGKDNFGKQAPHQLFALDVQTLKTRVLLTSEPKIRTRILSTNRLSPDVISITMNKRDSAQADVYKLNVRTGKTDLYLVNPGNVTEWFVDADGSIKLVKATEGAEETILFRSTELSAFKPIIKNNFRNSVRPIGFTGIKNYFYALSNVGRDKTAVVEIDAADGKEERVLYASNTADMQRVEYIKSRRRLELTAWDEAKPKKHFFDKGIETIYAELDKQLAGYEISITGRDTSEQRFIVSAVTDRSRGGIYLYERDGNKLTRLNDNAGPNPDDMSPMEPISYHATDGLFINGYITYPQGDKRTNLPVVVFAHDGPFGQRDSWGYRAETQFLASRGYAVLQINYRGSSGYGKLFYNAGFKEQGGKIQQDILDGVNWLVQNKIANPNKVAIMGRGFGGYSALYGVSFFPNKYNCAIALDAPINAFTYIKELPSFFKTTLQKRYEMFGDPDKDADMLKSISPVFNVGKVKSPLLMFQGELDMRLNKGELEHYVRGLQRRNVPITYVPQKNERWSGQTDSSKTKIYQQIEKFLHDNMLAKP
ncbi:dipeptidyl aminopeptidase/acylaminoacyl peptidase [Mucilaginibacter auburnensis]|uniref:Dipeptidyl aminopeptidase/acylaminoacyl peptidase n=1 Tax=Mucilaginibacter auburnensis TaxID=1457233 RepID=A0A2H9VPA6_9SPHI|nr:dipeptidyl aminopeptidase/acylaminoacyl peptidase [Mucilaginibacter auburnensis]